MSDLAGHDRARAAGARAGPSRARRALAMIAVVVGLGVAAWLGRDILLRSAAEWWIVSDRLGPADVVAVFGGGIEDRPFAAAAYYREGLVKKIALPDIRSSRAEQLGVLQSHFEANRRVLLKLGVPESAIERFGAGVSNTYEEVPLRREGAPRAGAPPPLLPTEILSAPGVEVAAAVVLRRDDLRPSPGSFRLPTPRTADGRGGGFLVSQQKKKIYYYRPRK